VTIFISESVWGLFLALTLWSVFYWYWSRFMHLRVQSASNFNGHLLDTTAWLFWGFPQSCLAASAFMWGVRSGTFAFGSTFEAVLALLLVMAGAMMLWVVAYLVVARPFRRPDIPQSMLSTVEEVMEKKPYTWYNCNPVYVLKCAYSEDVQRPDWSNPKSSRTEDEEALLYTRGKEYLYMQQHQQELIMRRLSDRLEFETYLEIFFGFCHWLGSCACFSSDKSKSNPPGYEELQQVWTTDDASRALTKVETENRR